MFYSTVELPASTEVLRCSASRTAHHPAIIIARLGGVPRSTSRFVDPGAGKRVHLQYSRMPTRTTPRRLVLGTNRSWYGLTLRLLEDPAPHLRRLLAYKRCDGSLPEYRPYPTSLSHPEVILCFLSLSLLISLPRNTIDETTAVDLQFFLRAASTVVHLEFDPGIIGAQMPVLQGADSLPRLKRLRHGLGSFKLSLRFSVEPTDHIMDEFDALGDAGVHVRVTRDQNVLLDTLQP
ncbi:hypothetical protein B0H14DRAFT_2638179 [Mycena olivaceomarginata]|nr:hypothetical protein B0H14DRAFT_2638179 [Mycena olivaceomarginata]